MKNIFKKISWKKIFLGITIYILLKIIGNWGWKQDFYTGLFITIAIFIYTLASAFRKGERGLESFDDYSNKKKKVTLAVVFISCAVATAFLVPIIITFTIPMIRILLLIIESIINCFKKPTLEPFALILIGGFQIIISLIVTLVFLTAIIYIWTYAFELAQKLRDIPAKKFEDKSK